MIPELIKKEDLMRILDNCACMTAFSEKCKDNCKDCAYITLSYWEILEDLGKLGEENDS